jgi:hypothetical protein
MGSLNVQILTHWFASNASVLAVIITVGVALLLGCCLVCSNCSCREKDEIFKHHEI